MLERISNTINWGVFFVLVLTFPASCEVEAIMWARLAAPCPWDTTMGVRPDSGVELDWIGVTTWTARLLALVVSLPRHKNQNAISNKKDPEPGGIWQNSCQSLLTFKCYAVVHDGQFATLTPINCPIRTGGQDIELCSTRKPRQFRSHRWHWGTDTGSGYHGGGSSRSLSCGQQLMKLCPTRLRNCMVCLSPCRTCWTELYGCQAIGWWSNHPETLGWRKKGNGTHHQAAPTHHLGEGQLAGWNDFALLVHGCQSDAPIDQFDHLGGWFCVQFCGTSSGICEKIQLWLLFAIDHETRWGIVPQFTLRSNPILSH